jgi:ribonuclease HI
MRKNKIQNKQSEISIYIDGAARGNPGPAGIGILLKDNEAPVKEIYKYIGEATNNIAEYSAAICGLQEAISLGFTKIALHLDSELVALQLKGEYRVKDASIKALFEKAIALINSFESVRIVKIDRENNKEADKLANKAINLSGLSSSGKIIG